MSASQVTALLQQYETRNEEDYEYLFQPKKSYWKPSIVPYFNFAIGQNEITTNSGEASQFGQTMKVPIDKDSDLVYSIYFECDLSDIAVADVEGAHVAWVPFPGLALFHQIILKIQSIELETLEKHQMWFLLHQYTENEKLNAAYELVGQHVIEIRKIGNGQASALSKSIVQFEHLTVIPGHPGTDTLESVNNTTAAFNLLAIADTMYDATGATAGVTDGEYDNTTFASTDFTEGNWGYLKTDTPLFKDDEMGIVTYGYNPDKSLQLYSASKNLYSLYIKIPFYFTKSTTYALPIVMLPAANFTIHTQFSTVSQVINSESGNAPSWTGDSYKPKILNPKYRYYYAVIHQDERAWFMDYIYNGDVKQLIIFAPVVSHIEFEEYSNKNSVQFGLEAFQHPTDALIFFVQDIRYLEDYKCNHFKYSKYNDSDPFAKDDPIVSAEIKFGGISRTGNLNAVHYRKISYIEHFNRVPEEPIYAFSFALDPLNPTQPSSSANFSRLYNISLKLQLDDDYKTQQFRVSAFTLHRKWLLFANGNGGSRYGNG